MSKVNIYKIDKGKHRAFEKNISEKLVLSQNRIIGRDGVENLDSEMVFTLYRTERTENKNVPWEWILSVFDDDILQTIVQPRAVVTVKYDNDIYALTFGHSYFLVDKYCDHNFAFSFARKMDYKEIKTTALTSPNSQRNKTIDNLYRL